MFSLLRFPTLKALFKADPSPLVLSGKCDGSESLDELFVDFYKNGHRFYLSKAICFLFFSVRNMYVYNLNSITLFIYLYNLSDLSINLYNLSDLSINLYNLSDLSIVSIRFIYQIYLCKLSCNSFYLTI